jgi:hypothetical protein
VDVFIKNLNSPIPKLRCYAAYTLGNLASVDDEGKITDQIKAIAQNLSNESYILQNYSVKALGKIARANPECAERIFNLLISHKKYFPKKKIGVIFDNMECFSDNKDLREDAIRFVESYTCGCSPQIKRKARDTLNKI